MARRYLALLLAILATTPAVALDINGELKRAQLEKLSSNPTAISGKVYYNTSSTRPRYYNGSAWLEAASVTGTETFTNKTLTSPTISGPTVTGSLLLQNPSGSQPDVGFSEDPDNGTNKATVRAPASLSGDYTLTLPTDDGSSDQFLKTDGSGALSWGSPAGAQNSSLDIKNMSLAVSVGSSALTIALKDASGSDPSGGSAVNIAFRNATETSGTYNVRSVTGALSMTVSSGSNLGHSSAESSPIYVYALDNSGTVELAVSTQFYDEFFTRSTTAEGGAGAADNSSVIYSTTARTNVPIRLLAKLVSSQSASGTWATVPKVNLAPIRFTPNSTVRCNTGNGHGSTNTKIRRFTNCSASGTAITPQPSSTLGHSFLINEAGVYSISYTDRVNAGTANFGISAVADGVSGNPTTSVNSLSSSERLIMSTAGTDFYNVSVTFLANAKDTVRPHTDGAPDNTGAGVQWVITQVAGF